MTFFVLRDDLYRPGRWRLGTIQQEEDVFEARALLRGERVSIGPPPWMTIQRPGTPQDFNFAAFDVPVVAYDLGEALSRICGEAVQRINVKVEGFVDSWEILNVTSRAECLASDSTFTRWDHNALPELAWKVQMMFVLNIDPAKAPAAPIFRPAEWSQSIIVREEVADLLRGKTGVLVEPLPLDLRRPKATKSKATP